MKGMITYQDEKKTKALLQEYGLKYLRTLKYLDTMVFYYEPGQELNAVAMAFKIQNLPGLTLEEKIIEVKNGS